MTTSTSTNCQPQEGIWLSVKPYAMPVLAASIAIVPAYFDFAAKSAIQLEKQPARMPLTKAIQGGFSLSPVVALLVGTQMTLQSQIERSLPHYFPHLFSADLAFGKTSLTLASSAIVGGFSSPVIAIFNDRLSPKPLGVKGALLGMNLKTVSAISLQETAFVGGLAATALVSAPMKQLFGDNKGVEYFSAALSGGCGSLLGQAGNTFLTRSQNKMKTSFSLKTLSLGAFRRARGCALFSMTYKCVHDILKLDF